MNFATTRPCFAASPRATANVPAMFTGRALKRRMAMVREVSQIVPHLPQEDGTTLHVILTGRADLMVLVSLLADFYVRLRPECRVLRLATLAFADRNVSEMAHLLTTGKVGSLVLLVSKFFRAHNPELFTRAKDEAVEFPGRWRMAASRNHAKLALLDLGDRKVTVESSANLRGNGNTEHASVTMDAGLHDFFATWIDQTVAQHEREEAEEPSDGR